MAIIIKKTKITNVDQDVDVKESWYTFGGNLNWCNHCGKRYWRSLKKPKVELPYDLAIPVLCVYFLLSTNLERTLVFLAALFTIVGSGKGERAM